MHLFAIVNPVSGAGADRDAARARGRILHERAAAAGVSLTVRPTEYPRHAIALAAEALRSGADTVLAWGGDGTINEVASVLARTSTPIAVVPSGSGNGFASQLGLPRDPADAIDVAIHGAQHAVDAGQVDERLFFNIAGIGLDAAVAARFNNQPAGHRGMGPYLRIGIREALRYKGVRYRLCLDGEPFERVALLIAFANGKEYGNGACIAPHAKADDGRLEAVVVDERSVPARLWVTRHLLLGTAQRAEGTIFRSVAEAVVEADRPMTYHVDGEIGDGGTTIRVRVLPGVLRVRVRRG